MRIGFDSKRAFFNKSGLGNYSRNLLNALSKYYKENDYYLFTPKVKDRIHIEREEQYNLIGPEKIHHKVFNSYWRTKTISGLLKSNRIEIYHGLSNELPLDIHKSEVKSVVTIHDLIFLRFPLLYKRIDRFFYLKKSTYSCRVAHKIIATSEQTKMDIVNFLNIEPSRIEVIYQGCNPIFFCGITNHLKDQIREKYQLPEDFLLYVGTIEKRKNLLNLIKAKFNHHIDLPLIVIGRKTDYFNLVNKYIETNRVKNIIFLDKVLNEELPSIYQMATCFVYPSLFEGFGIPILESLVSGTPVITSRDGCFSEAGGPDSIYIDPLDPEEIGNALNQLLSDKKLYERMVVNGLKYARNFTEEIVASNHINLYGSLTE